MLLGFEEVNRTVNETFEQCDTDHFVRISLASGLTEVLLVRLRLVAHPDGVGLGGSANVLGNCRIEVIDVLPKIPIRVMCVDDHLVAQGGVVHRKSFGVHDEAPFAFDGLLGDAQLTEIHLKAILLLVDLLPVSAKCAVGIGAREEWGKQFLKSSADILLILEHRLELIEGCRGKVSRHHRCRLPLCKTQEFYQLFKGWLLLLVCSMVVHGSFLSFQRIFLKKPRNVAVLPRKSIAYLLPTCQVRYEEAKRILAEDITLATYPLLASHLLLRTQSHFE